MPSDNQPQSEVERLKAKYTQRLEEIEQDEIAFKEQIQLLQRMLARVCLAADGQSDELDGHLDKLRDRLRGETPSLDELTDSMSDIETAMLKLDEEKEHGSNQVIEQLIEMTNGLATFDLPKRYQKQLKSLSKQLSNQQKSLQDTPFLLAEYAGIQTRVLAEKLGGGDDQAVEQSKGFFKSIFKSNRPTVDELPSHEVAQNIDGDSNDADHQYTSTETELASEDDPSLNSNDNDISELAGHVGSALRNLLGQLAVPDGSRADAGALKKRISQDFDWREIGDMLDIMANLVISAIMKGQQEFEAFLQLMEPRLRTIQGFLSTALMQHTERQGAEQKLQNEIQQSIKSLSGSLENSNDIEQLKESVSGNVDQILVTLSEFMVEEEGREHALQSELEMAQDRLNAMESELQQVKEKLKTEREKALTDVLTQLPNREAYNERFQLEYDRWQRYGNPTIICVADIDFFKKVNDTYGHLAGDRVIKFIAKELRRVFRKTDFVARIGGEEFLVLMPETNIEQAQVVLEKTRKIIEKLPFHFRDERVSVTMSFGVAAFTQGYSKEGLFEAADTALYRAKEGGRNRVVVADLVVK